MIPILCDQVEKSIGGKKENNETEAEEPDLWTSEQQPELLHLLADELKVDQTDIADFELSLFDTQGAATGGMRSEFLCSSRIDNLASCFVAVEALETHAKENLADDDEISVVALFDHEEVGSDSNPGAGSTIMRDAVVRISNALSEDDKEDNEVFKAALAR